MAGHPRERRETPRHPLGGREENTPRPHAQLRQSAPLSSMPISQPQRDDGIAPVRPVRRGEAVPDPLRSGVYPDLSRILVPLVVGTIVGGEPTDQRDGGATWGGSWRKVGGEDGWQEKEVLQPWPESGPPCGGCRCCYCCCFIILMVRGTITGYVLYCTVQYNTHKFLWVCTYLRS